jgi:methylase of polypeptide subunit release factors
MSLLYRIFYQVGFTPWEDGATHRPAAQQIARPFAREEHQQQPPFGPALDLGCGTGIWTVNLAERGWQVTGIDNVPKAVTRARERVQAAVARCR